MRILDIGEMRFWTTSYGTHILIRLSIFAACAQQLCTYSRFLQLSSKTGPPLACRPDLTWPFSMSNRLGVCKPCSNPHCINNEPLLFGVPHPHVPHETKSCSGNICRMHALKSRPNKDNLSTITRIQNQMQKLVHFHDRFICVPRWRHVTNTCDKIFVGEPRGPWRHRGNQHETQHPNVISANLLILMECWLKPFWLKCCSHYALTKFAGTAFSVCFDGWIPFTRRPREETSPWTWYGFSFHSIVESSTC